MPRLVLYYSVLESSPRFLKKSDSKDLCIRMELINESLVIDLVENQKLSYEQAICARELFGHR